VIDSILNDLINPIKTLMSLSCPSGGTLATLSTLVKPSMVSVSIPDILYMEKAYITNVGANFMKPLVSDGKKTVPQKIVVPITLMNATIVTVDRATKMFFP
jgi:hypothetical protein